MKSRIMIIQFAQTGMTRKTCRVLTRNFWRIHTSRYRGRLDKILGLISGKLTVGKGGIVTPCFSCPAEAPLLESVVLSVGHQMII
jgi:hypothetical protein